MWCWCLDGNGIVVGWLDDDENEVDYLDRLIDNLCTISFGQLRLHANFVRLQRESKAYSSQPKKGNKGFVKNSFAFVLKSGKQNPIMLVEPTPAIVLDDSCIMEKVFSYSIMGKIKDINVLSNLYVILANEGFENVKLAYLGGFWVLLDSDSISSKEKISNHVGVASWFLLHANNSFVSDERIVWIYVVCLPIKTLTRNTFAKIISLWGELTNVEDPDNLSLSYKKLCVKTRPHTPDFSNELGDNSSYGEEFEDDEAEHISGKKGVIASLLKKSLKRILNRKNDKEESSVVYIGLGGRYITDISFIGGSSPRNRYIAAKTDISLKGGRPSRYRRAIFTTLEESNGKDLAFPPGFTPDTVDENVIENNGDSIHQTNVNLHSNNEGILCVWDPSLFIKDNVTIFDSILAIRGDFNEVRSEQERFGTTFNVLGVNAFNHFITIAGLVDLSLEELQDLNASASLDMAQKAKIHWSIEKDENSKYFHGIINKNMSQSAIHRVLVEGDLINEPSNVKNEFLNHFSNQFVVPLHLESQFSTQLTLDKIDDLKRNVTYDEIKRAVWDYGSIKSPGLDGFTIEFLRRYWNLIDQDVLDTTQDVEVVKDFRPISLIDDAVFVGEWDKSNLITIVNVLKCFFLASGLKINLHKSKLMGIGIPQDDVNMAANFIGCNISTMPFNYLGVKVGVIMSRSSSWEDVLAKNPSRLTKWKLKTLSIGGRLTLINSVLSFMPLYQMSIYKVPVEP
ncbi:hypothetical protein Tco_1458073 [Tanacetum coccineum]